jgi:carboxymethylenebutenolidase
VRAVDLAVPDIAVPYFTALPDRPPPWPGIVVVMEGTGISPQLLRVCERLAQEGFATVAPDLYWRFGGGDPDKTMEYVGALRHADGLADVAGAVGRLRSLGASRIGATGFCMGGGYAYLAALSGEVDAAVPFYGGGIAQHLGSPRCPLLAFFGGRDEWIPRDDVARVEQHHSGDVVVYEDAGHGFMRDGSDSYHETAAADAWGRMLEFFRRHLQES